jgi:predicted hexulose-6-phosphate isomerase
MNPIGIYEKALTHEASWPQLMRRARTLGFDFLEIAIDETDDKLARLKWSNAEKSAFSRARLDEGLPVNCLIFSALRKWPLGAPNAATRRQGVELLRRGIDFASQTGIRCLQLPGYYSFYAPAGPDGGARFTEALIAASAFAACAGVMLALENMDGSDITDIPTALAHVQAVGSPWLRLYPDIGNLAANGHDVEEQIRIGGREMIGIHVKDARPGQYRRVPFGAGCVPFERAFSALARIPYAGPFLIEMWNDDDANSDAIARSALTFVQQQLGIAYAEH